MVLHSVPSTDKDPTPRIIASLTETPARIVYLSTTGVYGDTSEVDATTVPQVRTNRERLRLDAEQAVASGPWSSMILRPAAIYGPGRGVHASMRRGTFRLYGDRANIISRIHVDDLAAVVEAAMLSSYTGAWPVADLHPSSSYEIASFCASLMRIPMPPHEPAGSAPPTRQSNRRVDGRAILQLLGLELRYPSYREGIPACIAQENRERLG